MGTLNLKALFGRRHRKYTLGDLRSMAQATASDGTARVVPTYIWDDPKIGAMLRKAGVEPDSPSNIRMTVQDYRARFARSKAALDERIADFDKANEARYGYCRAAPFLIVDQSIWDGEHGSFLFAGLDLVAYDEWNILILALDEETMRRCGLPLHIGPIPSLNDMMTEFVIRLKARREHALEAFGLTATGQSGGISREHYQAIEQELVSELKAYAAACGTRLVAWLKSADEP